jgi:hypothetical protein
MDKRTENGHMINAEEEIRVGRITLTGHRDLFIEMWGADIQNYLSYFETIISVGCVFA